ncbi:MAG TPA: hypothetical protein VNN62_06275 [Methylomirabilota bacterium]|jgi:hypothetical protein|nr:hypothetical protein [Methylomirabilota bacterium]
MIKLSVRSWMNGAPLTIGPQDNLSGAEPVLHSAPCSVLTVQPEAFRFEPP